MTTRDRGITLPIFQDRFNVKDFGAKGDGLTDDTIAIQSAFNATTDPNAASMVYFPPGSYVITAPIQVPGVASFMGVGQASILMPNDCNCFEFQASAYVAARTFSNLWIFGQSCQNRIALRANLDSTIGQRITGCTFENLYISWYGTSAWLRGVWFSEFMNCYFLNSFKSCVISGQCVKVAFYGCKFDRGNGVITGVGKSIGFSMDPNGINRAEDIVLNNCLVYGYQIQVNIDSVLYFAILACDIDRVLETGVQIGAVGGGGTIRDCWFGFPEASPHVGVPQQGIEFINLGTPRGYNVTVDNNYMEFHTTPPNANSNGVKIGSNQNNVVVQNCDFEGFPTGIYNNGGNAVKLLNNIINTVDWSIVLAFGDRNYIEGNILGARINTNIATMGRVNYGYNQGIQTTKYIGTVAFGAGSTIESKTWAQLGMEPILADFPSYHKVFFDLQDTLPFERGSLKAFVLPDWSGIIFQCTTPNPSAVPMLFRVECFTGT